MRQISNAYALLPCSQWRGYKPPPPPPPPPPAPGTWGDHPSMGSALDVAATLRWEGASRESQYEAMESDPTDGLGKAMALLGRAVEQGEKPCK
jgi:hypothetical protein